MATAWPASWIAVRRRSWGVTTRLRFSGPAMTFMMASSMSDMEMKRSLRRAASRAASFSRLERSAPVKPVVARAITPRSTSSARGLSLEWTFKMASRPLESGTPM